MAIPRPSLRSGPPPKGGVQTGPPDFASARSRL